MRMNIVVDGYMCNSGQDDHHDYHIYSEGRQREKEKAMIAIGSRSSKAQQSEFN